MTQLTSRAEHKYVTKSKNEKRNSAVVSESFFSNERSSYEVYCVLCLLVLLGASYKSVAHWLKSSQKKKLRAGIGKKSKVCHTKNNI